MHLQHNDLLFMQVFLRFRDMQSFSVLNYDHFSAFLLKICYTHWNLLCRDAGGTTLLYRHKSRDFSTFTARLKTQSVLETCIDPGPKILPLLLQEDHKVIKVEPREQGFAFLMMDYIAEDSESLFIIQIFTVPTGTKELCPFVTKGNSINVRLEDIWDLLWFDNEMMSGDSPLMILPFATVPPPVLALPSVNIDTWLSGNYFPLTKMALVPIWMISLPFCFSLLADYCIDLTV